MEYGVIVCGIGLGVGVFFLAYPKRGRQWATVRQWCNEAGLAGVPLSIVAVVLGTVAVIAGFLVAAVIPLTVIAPLGVLVGFAVPIITLSSVRSARTRRARAAWPDLIDSLRVSLRSGSTVVESFASANPMVPTQWRRSWSELQTNLSRGLDTDIALRRLQDELADPIADRVVESLIITREFGGTELPIVLSELGRSIRREQAIRDEARTRQSWVRHAATLGVVAPWVVLALLASRPENREAYATPAGTVVIVCAAGATIVAYLVMSALGTLREPHRWLVGGRRD